MKLSIHHTWVALQISGQFIDKVKSLYIPTDFNPEKNHVVYGICIAAPQRLLYFKKEIDAIKNEFGGTINAPLDRAEEIREMTARSTMYETEMELKQGDFVFYKYNTYYQAKIDGRIFKNQDGIFILIPYDCCYIAIRGDQIIPLNGLVLLEPIMEKSSDLLLEEKESTLKGKICYLGQKVKSYLQYPDDGSDDDFYNVGDTVMYRKNSAVVFEDSLHRKLDKKYMRLWRRDLLGKVNSPA